MFGPNIFAGFSIPKGALTWAFILIMVASTTYLIGVVSIWVLVLLFLTINWLDPVLSNMLGSFVQGNNMCLNNNKLLIKSLLRIQQGTIDDPPLQWIDQTGLAHQLDVVCLAIISYTSCIILRGLPLLALVYIFLPSFLFLIFRMDIEQGRSIFCCFCWWDQPSHHLDYLDLLEQNAS
ncbi:hypothetical protein M5689_013283 [Euphorbia peplus]|nr:hypothetical protein M5689_013283 [Euphorbia peplus]